LFWEELVVSAAEPMVAGGGDEPRPAQATTMTVMGVRRDGRVGEEPGLWMVYSMQRALWMLCDGNRNMQVRKSIGGGGERGKLMESFGQPVAKAPSQVKLS
jgi:hypothetical protein